MDLLSKIYVAGHNGMVGSAVVRQLNAQGYTNIITKTRKELDLKNTTDVADFFALTKPDFVVLAAAKVGGIFANNTYRAEFLFDNLCIQNNVIHQAYVNKVKKLLFLGSSCIYPKLAQQPINEDALLTGALESTNEPYAIAKITGIKMCEAYRDQYGCNFVSAMPTNLYGLNDNYHPENSHVLPALIRKFHEAKTQNLPTVTVWGDGTPLREFLYADDLAEALVFILKTYNEKLFLNVGYGTDLTIADLANTIKECVGYQGSIVFDTTKPNGTPRKLMDSTRLFNLGWKPKTDLKTGIRIAYADFLQKN